MRQTCQLSFKHDDGDWVCGKPAVDYVMRTNSDGDEYKFWVCAEHFDGLTRIREILKRVEQNRTEY